MYTHTYIYITIYMVISVNGGTPKWMVCNGTSIYKWMMTGGTPISGNFHVYIYIYHEMLYYLCSG